MSNPFNHADMVANILAYRASATCEQVEAGRQWYPTAGKIVLAIADATGIVPSSVALCLAALSPRNPWRWNVADCYAFCAAKAEGRLMPTGATTFKRNSLAAWRALSDEVPWLTAAPKVRAFAACVNGHVSSVVVDTWAIRVATGGELSRISTDAQYAKIAMAYTTAAAILDEDPCVTQAITWIVAQTEGLATARRGRHDLSIKAGTAPFVRHLLAPEGS